LTILEIIIAILIIATWLFIIGLFINNWFNMKYEEDYYLDKLNKDKEIK